MFLHSTLHPNITQIYSSYNNIFQHKFYMYLQQSPTRTDNSVNLYISSQVMVKELLPLLLIHTFISEMVDDYWSPRCMFIKVYIILNCYWNYINFCISLVKLTQLLWHLSFYSPFVCGVFFPFERINVIIIYDEERKIQPFLLCFTVE